MKLKSLYALAGAGILTLVTTGHARAGSAVDATCQLLVAASEARVEQQMQAFLPQLSDPFSRRKGEALAWGSGRLAEAAESFKSSLPAEVNGLAASLTELRDRKDNGYAVSQLSSVIELKLQVDVNQTVVRSGLQNATSNGPFDFNSRRYSICSASIDVEGASIAPCAYVDLSTSRITYELKVSSDDRRFVTWVELGEEAPSNLQIDAAKLAMVRKGLLESQSLNEVPALCRKFADARFEAIEDAELAKALTRPFVTHVTTLEPMKTVVRAN